VANHSDVSKLRASDGVQLGRFLVGGNPRGVAFDGAHIWVTNSGDDTVSKLRPSDGVELGPFPVGDAPLAVAFDGAHIWVANANDDTVSKH
jgi:DNA-binding beta-propeller fold protein YncE